MDLSTTILGSTVAKALTARQAEAVLVIGRDRFVRAELAHVACFNFVAAANLTRVLGDLNVKDTADVFARIDPLRLVVPRLGAVSLAVLGAAFEIKKLGGRTPLLAWYHAHREGRVVTFEGLKTRARATERRAHGLPSAARTDDRARAARARAERPHDARTLCVRRADRVAPDRSPPAS